MTGGDWGNGREGERREVTGGRPEVRAEILKITGGTVGRWNGGRASGETGGDCGNARRRWAERREVTWGAVGGGERREVTWARPEVRAERLEVTMGTAGGGNGGK